MLYQLRRQVEQTLGLRQITGRESFRKASVNWSEQAARVLDVPLIALQSGEARRSPQLPGQSRLFDRQIKSATKVGCSGQFRIGRVFLQYKLALDPQQLREAPVLLAAFRSAARTLDRFKRLGDFSGSPHGGGKLAQQPQVAR